MAVRPNWDETWYSLAKDMAKRSICSRRKVGSVIVDSKNRIVATGYNGPPGGSRLTCGDCPRNQKQDLTVGYDNCFAIHAEANALLFCDRRDREGGTIYSTLMPCWECSRLIANSGLSRFAVPFWAPEDQHREPGKAAEFLIDMGLDLVWLED